MSRVFQASMSTIADASGCDWDFVVDMYNHIFEKEGDVDLERFGTGVFHYDWTARGDGRFRYVLEDLGEKSGYEYNYLFDRLVDMIYDTNDDSDWTYFVGVTMEHDW